MTSHLFAESESLGIWECDLCGWWGETPENPHDCKGYHLDLVLLPASPSSGEPTGDTDG
jgi:hypothetical protein